MSSRYIIARYVLETLPATLRATRVNAKITVRAAAHEMGMSTRTLARLEADPAGHNHRHDTATLVKALTFIDAHQPVE
jgi:transcriptional regulator with XRE-family HTH domain